MMKIHLIKLKKRRKGRSGFLRAKMSSNEIHQQKVTLAVALEI